LVGEVCLLGVEMMLGLVNVENRYQDVMEQSKYNISQYQSIKIMQFDESDSFCQQRI
jgi:hypothetical protein